MASGIHSTIASLHNRLMLRWVPKWYGAFADPSGGFYERLGKGFKPVLTGQRRLLTQCRQLAVYGDAVHRNHTRFKCDLRAAFEFIVARYHDPETGLWHYALDDDGNVANAECDLYALSFVIFSFSHYYRASGDERARDYARQALGLVTARFALPGLPGFAESIIREDGAYKPIPKIRRQNPHMHLLEACLFAHAVWRDAAYERMADELVGLFHTYLYDARRGLLHEFFTDDLKPHPQEGARLEPGHFLEWVWLLKKHAAMKGEASMHDDTAMRLLEWGNLHGWDREYGGIYDVVDDAGQVLEPAKRIWPFCEALKANALMLVRAPDRQAVKDRVAEMVRVFEKKYMQERGFWVEWLGRDLEPRTDYMPGTTPYHVYFGITETHDVLERRGGMISIGGAVRARAYAFRRSLSAVMKKMRRLMPAA
ncbi:MAG: AGE family epimerase/isomerase [Micavibrio sp.]